MRIRDCKDEPYFPAERISISCELGTKTIFMKNNATKRRKYNMNIHKAMRIPDGIL